MGRVGDATPVGILRPRCGDDGVLGVVTECCDIESLFSLSHDSPQSLTRTRHRDVARINDSTDDPTQNQITVVKS